MFYWWLLMTTPYCKLVTRTIARWAISSSVSGAAVGTPSWAPTTGMCGREGARSVQGPRHLHRQDRARGGEGERWGEKLCNEYRLWNEKEYFSVPIVMLVSCMFYTIFYYSLKNLLKTLKKFPPVTWQPWFRTEIQNFFVAKQSIIADYFRSVF